MSVEFEQNIEEEAAEPASCEDLLRAYQESTADNPPQPGELLDVETLSPRSNVIKITAPIRIYKESELDAVIGELTAYNPAYLSGGPIAARIEPFVNHDSRIAFFDPTNPRKLVQLPDTPILPLEDPFATPAKVGNKTLIGGVNVDRNLNYQTLIYGFTNNIDELHEQGGAIVQPIIEGPPGMKGIRPFELPDGRVGVFTRPQGKKGGRGKIGYFEARSLETITQNQFEEAEIIPGLFRDDEWGGVNEATLLADGRIGVLGHIARFIENPNGPKPLKEYYSITFEFDPSNRTFSGLQIIGTATDSLPHVYTKNPDISDETTYPGGLVPRPDGTVEFWRGICDVAVAKSLISDPFAGLRG